MARNAINVNSPGATASIRGEIHSPGDGNHAPQTPAESSEHILYVEAAAEVGRLRVAYESVREELANVRQDAADDYAMVATDITNLAGIATRLLEQIRPWQTLPGGASTTATALALSIASLPNYEKFAKVAARREP